MSQLKQQGFSLIELMIVVAIVAILATIAYPMYEENKLKSSRADGQAALSKAAQAQERYFTDNDTYANTVTALRGFTGDDSEHGLYKLTVECPGGNCAAGFTLVATPNFASDVDKCYQLTLNSSGTKSNRLKDGTTDTSRCW